MKNTNGYSSRTARTLLGALTITLVLLAAKCTLAQQPPAFVWTKLPGHTNLPPGFASGWLTLPGAFDADRGILYSLSQNGIFWKYDIRSNTFTQLPVSGWPGTAGQYVYNPDENTIWLTLNGRGQVFRLPVAGGTVTSVGASGASYADFSNIGFWNPVTHKFQTAFGYGFMAVRNWRWEFGTNDSDWVQIEANTPDREPWCRSSSGALDFSGKRLFVYGGMGNSSGQQGQFDPGFYNNGNQFDYLRDLWVLSFQSNQWRKLIPLNTSIPVDGRIVYFPPLDTLLMINASQLPPSGAGSPVTGLWSFNIEHSSNWTQVTATGDVPAVADDAGSMSVYDSPNQRIIYFNNRGVYALNAGPRITLMKAVKPSFSDLSLGTNYQLQVSADLSTWTNQGSAFTATNSNMICPQYWDVDNWSSLFFRLQVVP